MAVNQAKPFSLSNSAEQIIAVGGYHVVVQVDNPANGTVSITAEDEPQTATLWDDVNFGALSGVSKTFSTTGPISGVRITAGASTTITGVVRELKP